jgi:hypothetical protein
MLVNSEDPNKDIREKALKHLYELSLKTIGEIPQLTELTEEQKKYVKKMMRGWTCE